jgi:hypothetical protein
MIVGHDLFCTRDIIIKLREQDWLVCKKHLQSWTVRVNVSHYEGLGGTKTSLEAYSSSLSSLLSPPARPAIIS